MPFLPVELETASQAPRSAQTGPCQAFLWTGAQPPCSTPLCSHLPLLLTPVAPSPLISASHTAFFYELAFHESNCSFTFQLRNKDRKKKLPREVSL